MKPGRSDNLTISPQDLVDSHSQSAGGSGNLSSKLIPPVIRNLKYSSDNSPLKENSLEHSRKDNNNLSFSNKDLQILLYKEYKKYYFKLSNLITKSSDFSLLIIAKVNKSI